MENELLLKSLENLLDKKLEPISKRLDSIDKRLDNMEIRLDNMEIRLDNLEAGQNKIRTTQETILKFVSHADTEFMKLEEKTKDIDIIKKVINNVK